MMRTLDLRGQSLGHRELRSLVPRAALDVAHAVSVVTPILEDVQVHGSAALLRYAEKFDGAHPAHLRVPKEVLASSLANLDPRVRQALEIAIDRVRIVHQAQLRAEETVQVVAGGKVTERWLPVERVGLYVPGGLAVYPSSVIMNVVPAQIAGVASVAVTSPPHPEFGNLPHPTILAACELLGVDEVYAVGGAQAIGMFAYGVDDELLRCPSVDMITGPGNVWVAAAKRVVRGRVGIDSEAGPTEIAILADESAVPEHVAADLISQAEHDTIAAAILITPSANLAQQVEGALAKRVAATKHSHRIEQALKGEQSAIVLVDSLEQGLEVVDAYAAEHLEIHTHNAAEVARRVRNAGAIFVGTYAPVSLGDYAAGSNHVLPTGGCACHSSGLSVHTFLRAIHLVEYNAAALEEVAPYVITLANAEDLPAHGEAIQVRFDERT